MLKLENLHVALEDGTEIVKGVDLEVDTNEVHAVMGPNGSGKSTLAYALMGHPAYEITEGRLLFDGDDVTELGADERAQRGLFLAFQYPHAIPGVTVTSFLRSAFSAERRKLVTVTPGIACGYWKARKRPCCARSSAPISTRSSPPKRISPSVIS